jgi:hypothetical protein
MSDRHEAAIPLWDTPRAKRLIFAADMGCDTLESVRGNVLDLSDSNPVRRQIGTDSSAAYGKACYVVHFVS